MSARVELGVSPCPNDTFAFHGLLTGRIDTRGLDLDLRLADVEELNRSLLAGRLDVGKGSFHAALLAGDELGVLPVGAALGFGNGPLLVASRAWGATPPGPECGVLAPGEHTTAALLYRLFHPEAAAPRHVVFSDVLPALERGEADVGVCIHEGRFTYAERGLVLVEDLGERWERATGMPLPLGGLFARRSLPVAVVRAVTEAIADSLEYAWAHPDEALDTMRRHATELADDVLRAHVELYVNPWTRDLGPEGRAALGELARRARSAGIVPTAGGTPLAVVGTPRIFHMAPAAEWERGRGAPWRPPSLEAEGFVHLSLTHQLADSRALHLADAGDLTLVEVDPGTAGDALRLEPSRRGALFPHLHRELRPADVLAEWTLARDAPLPRLGRDAADDAPGGSRPHS